LRCQDKSIGFSLRDLLLCLLLLVGQPINLAIGSARALGSLQLRGLPVALVVLGSVMFATVGLFQGHESALVVATVPDVARVARGAAIGVMGQ